jgi:hypothetical protein
LILAAVVTLFLAFFSEEIMNSTGEGLPALILAPFITTGRASSLSLQKKKDSFLKK